MHMLTRNIHWLVRLVIAAIYLFHGVEKLPADQFAEHFGLPLSIAYLVAVGEIFIAVCIFFGGLGLSWLTRLGGFCMIIIMVGAIVVAKWGLPWSGMEFDVLLFVLGLSYLVRGNR